MDPKGPEGSGTVCKVQMRICVRLQSLGIKEMRSTIWTKDETGQWPNHLSNQFTTHRQRSTLLLQRDRHTHLAPKSGFTSRVVGLNGASQLSSENWLRMPTVRAFQISSACIPAKRCVHFWHAARTSIDDPGSITSPSQSSPAMKRQARPPSLLSSQSPRFACG